MPDKKTACGGFFIKYGLSSEWIDSLSSGNWRKFGKMHLSNPLNSTEFYIFSSKSVLFRGGEGPAHVEFCTE